MDWNRLEGNWKQFRGSVKEKWGRLTDDDLDVINGRQEQLGGKIQERYGLAKDQAKKDVDAWFKSLPYATVMAVTDLRFLERLLTVASAMVTECRSQRWPGRSGSGLAAHL